MLGLAVIAALALTAIAGATSASASTVLCSENASTCKAASTYASGTTIEASLKSGTKFVIATEAAPLGNPTCGKSTLTAKTSAKNGLDSYGGLPVEITGLTLSECASPCTKGEVSGLHPLHDSGLVHTGGGNGTMTASGSSLGGDPQFKFSSCPFGAVCYYTAKSIPFSFEGGNPSSLVAKEAPLTRGSGSSFGCPETGKLRASYGVTSPKPAYATSPEKGSGKIGLCKVAEEPCPSGQSYSSGQEFEWSGTVVVSRSAYEDTCSGSISSKMLASSAESSLPMEFGPGTLGCNVCPEATIAKDSKASLERTGEGTGVLTTQLTLTEWSCQFGSEHRNCVWSGKVKFNVIGGTSAKLVSEYGKNTLEIVEPSLGCGSTAQLVATLTAKLPNGKFWVTETS
jgi:hypothetical protein